MPQMTGGQALAESLKREGVETVFGLPGVQLDWAFDALYGARDSITSSTPGTSRRRPTWRTATPARPASSGCFIVVPGPGVLNAAGALSTAYSVNSPVLCITGQIQSDLIGIGRGVLHEVDDQLGMLAHITKWDARAMHPERGARWWCTRPSASSAAAARGRWRSRSRRTCLQQTAEVELRPAPPARPPARRPGPAGAGGRPCWGRPSAP